MNFFLYFVYLTILYRTAKSQNVFANGPTDIIINRLIKCPYNEATGIIFFSTMKKISRTKIGFDANMTFPFPVGDNFQVLLDMSRWGDGGWKHNVLNLKSDKLCTWLTVFFGPIWVQIRDRFSPKIPPDCPIPSNKYELRDLFVDWSLLPLNLPLVGRFLLQMTWYNNTDRLFCHQVEASLVERNLKISRG